jgi:anthranilate synthase/aminodeoxychorismate synthase-like glutamine amidotransferase
MLQHASVQDVLVCKNDAISVEEALSYQHIIISPGPKLPSQSGIIVDVCKHAHSQKILGICLGHQAIAEAYGYSLYQLAQPNHGAQATLTHHSKGIFNAVPQNTSVGLYHSWAVHADMGRSELHTTATTKDDLVMAVQHSSKPIYGVQFHIESYITLHGQQMLENWLQS